MNDETNERFAFGDVFGENTHCGKENDLLRYFEHKLPVEEERLFNEHLLNCHPCANQLAALQNEENVILNTTLDAERAQAIFDKGRVAFRAALDVNAANAARPAASPGFRLPAYVNAVMLVLIGLLAYPAYRSFMLEEELARTRTELAAEKSRKQQQAEAKPNRKAESSHPGEPALSGTAVYSARSERGEEDKSIVVEFTPNRKTFSLVFALTPGDFDSFQVEILRNSETIWSREVQPDSKTPVITLSLSDDSLKEGDYALRIAGRKGQSLTPITSYSLKIIRSH